jgi:hypothetical protein
VLLTQAVQTVVLEHWTQFDSTEAQVEQLLPLRAAPVLQDVQTEALEQVRQLVFKVWQDLHDEELRTYWLLIQLMQVEVLEQVAQLLIKLLQGGHIPPESAAPDAHVKQVVALEQVKQDIIR